MSLDPYTRKKLLLAPAFLLVCSAALEIALRFFCPPDGDGNRGFARLRLKPFHLPVRAISHLVSEFNAVPLERRKLLYDPDVGWVSPYAPSAPLAPPAGTNANNPRISLYGASYSANIGAPLEKALNDTGMHAKVYNFACGGYGTDQALLRWQKDGTAFHPDVVLFGLTRQNSEYNTNLLRILVQPDTGTPFLKPRFLLSNGQLKLINAPTPPPEAVPEIVAHFGGWPLAGHENYFRPSDFGLSLWRRSVLLAFLEARVLGEDKASSGSGNEGQVEATQLMLRIISQLKQETEAAGSRFLILHLPVEADLLALQKNGEYPFPDLLAAAREISPVIEPGPALLEAAKGHNLSHLFADGHYTHGLNDVVGRVAANALLATPDLRPSPGPVR